jgi:DNA-binding response OmpR family regulator
MPQIDRPLILIAEDDPEQRGLLKRLLQGSYRIIESRTGTETVNQLKERRPQAVLLDLLLGDGPKGLDICQAVMKSRLTTDVLVMSGQYKTFEDKVKVLSKGAVGFFGKPFDLMNLALCVKALFDPAVSGNSSKQARNILLIDDHREILDMFSAFLDGGKYNTLQASCASLGILIAMRENIDAIVLDLGLPDVPGQELLRLFKAVPRTAKIPILVATSSTDPMIKRIALDKGANGCIIKNPVEWPVFVDEIDKLLSVKVSTAANILGAGAITVDKVKFTVSVEDRPVSLTEKEFDLLVYFINHQDEVLAWGHLVRNYWRREAGSLVGKSIAAVDTALSRLRSKLGAPADGYFETVRGVGVRFTVR